MKNRDPGRTRVKIAEMLEKQLGIIVEPADIWQNNYPAAKWLDLARWGVDGKKNGRHISVSSWDRMGDIVKSKVVACVVEDFLSIEVCSGGGVS